MSGERARFADLAGGTLTTRYPQLVTSFERQYENGSPTTVSTAVTQ